MCWWAPRGRELFLHNPELGEVYGGIDIVGVSRGQSRVRFPHLILNVCEYGIGDSPR